MFFSSFWYIICWFLSSITSRKVGLIIWLCSWGVLEYFRRSLNSRQSGGISMLVTARWYGCELFYVIKRVGGVWNGAVRSFKARRRRVLSWTSRPLNGVFAESESVVEFLVSSRSVLHLSVEFWALECDSGRTPVSSRRGGWPEGQTTVWSP